MSEKSNPNPDPQTCKYQNEGCSFPVMIDPAWYKDYFSAPYGEIYSEYLLPDDMTRSEAAFARKALKLKASHRILDCPCGFGRHLAELAPKYPRLTGLDLDADNLSRAAARSARIPLVRADMRSLPFGNASFDIILNLFNSFGYFSRKEDRKLLGEFARVLAAGGRLLIDAANPRPLAELVKEYPRTQQQVGELVVSEEWSYDTRRRILMNNTQFDLAGKVSKRSYALQLYTAKEYAKMLSGAGFAMESVYGDFDGQEYDEGESPRLIVIGKRN